MQDFPRNVTIGDKYGPAMKITDPVEAQEYFERCVRHAMLCGQTRQEAESVERQNLGYFAGYYDRETMERVNRLFRTTHPIFGATAPTPGEAIAACQQLAARAKEN